MSNTLDNSRFVNLPSLECKPLKTGTSSMFVHSVSKSDYGSVDIWGRKERWKEGAEGGREEKDISVALLSGHYITATTLECWKHSHISTRSWKPISLPFLFRRVPRTDGYMLFVGFQVSLDQSMKQHFSVTAFPHLSLLGCFSSWCQDLPVI